MMRVLVVEDNALLRHHLKVQLQEMGHQVDDAEDAKEADYYLNEHLPDIAIVDLGLPDEDGLSLIRRWRSHDVSLQVDLSRRELAIHDEVIKLTAFEYTIMETLIRNSGKVVSKDSLMLQLYPDAELRESHTIDVLMGRLRKKIQAQYPEDVITTVRGQGYLFELR